MNPPEYPAEPLARRSEFSSGVKGQNHPKNSMEAPHTSAGRWIQGAQRHRRASRPPNSTKTINARWAITTRSARTR